MKTNNWIKKGLALAITALFLGIGTITATGDIEIEKYTDLEASNYTESTVSYDPDDNCYPVIYGIEGENNWFITDVDIFFVYGPMVVEIWYNLKGEWVNYTGWFTFTEEGDFHLDYRWKLIHGEWINATTATRFKIDKNPPTINLNKKISPFDKKKITFTANVNDGQGSGIKMVEFYLDGELQKTVKEPDYIFVYENPGRTQEVEAIVYDFAGFSNSDNSDTSSASHSSLLMSRIFQRIHTLVQLLINLIKIMVPS